MQKIQEQGLGRNTENTERIIYK